MSAIQRAILCLIKLTENPVVRYNVSDGQGLPDTFLGHGAMQQNEATNLVIGIGSMGGEAISTRPCIFSIYNP